MTPEQFEQLQKTVADQIKFTVNGKIDKMNDKMDTYIREDNEWKTSVTPSIETMKKIEGFGTTGLYLLKAIIALGAAGTAILAIIHWFQK